MRIPLWIQVAAPLIQAFSAAVIMIWTIKLVGATTRYASDTKRMADEMRDSLDLTRDLVRVAEGNLQEANRQSELFRQEVELGRQTLNWSVQPALVDVPFGEYLRREEVRVPESGFANYLEDRASLILYDSEEYVTVSIPLRNVGAGTAFIRGLGLNFGADGTAPYGRATLMVVPPNELTRLSFAVPKIMSELQPNIPLLLNGNFVVSASYTNAAGEEPWKTQAHCHLGRDGRAYVRQIMIWRPGASEPFVASGPIDP